MSLSLCKDGEFPSPPSDRGWQLDDITLKHRLPFSSNVFQATICESGYDFILKQLQRNHTEYPPSSSIQTESSIHLTVQHPNVIRCFGIFEHNNSINLMMELATGGDLFDAMKLPTHSLARTKRFLRDIINGLKYLHDHRILHRDLRLENIVLDASGHCKIVEFGFGTVLKPGETHVSDACVCGTVDYVAPELLRREPYNEGVDIWCVGIIAHILMTKLPPFAPWTCSLPDDHQRRSITRNAILDGKIDWSYESAADMCAEGRDFVSKILVHDQSKRLTLDEMIVHPFLERGEGSAKLNNNLKSDSKESRD
eukprot:115451_1